METLLDLIPAWQLITLAAVFGALWGSFANVVIVRWPAEMSVLRPASHCFSCKRPVRFYDNIPVLSYLLLRGRCRHCGARFSPRYLVVELAMALLSVGVLRLTLLADPPSLAYGLGAYFVWFSFAWALVTAGMIDLETFLLPDAITLPGIVVGLLANGLVLKNGWIDPVVGAAGGYAVLSLLFVHGYKLLTGKQGMGEGDPKLLAMIGAFLGVEGAVFALFAGAVQGLVAGTLLVVYRRRTGTEPPLPSADDEEDDDEVAGGDDDPRLRKARVPFGPFLAIGALEYLLAGGNLLGLWSDALFGLLGN